MTDIGYIKMEEVPGILQLAKTPGAVVYSPLGETPVDPDVVIFAGPAAQIMLLQEAAHRAGRTPQSPMLGRPTCMAIPAAMARGAPSPVPGAWAIESTRIWRMANCTRWCRGMIWSALRMNSRRLPPPMRSLMSIIGRAARKFRRSTGELNPPLLGSITEREE